MGFLSKILSADPESEKIRRFGEIDRQFADKPEMANLAKAQWLTNRGNDFRRRNLFDRAITDFKEAITFNPNHIHAHISWGMVCGKNGKLKEAIDILEKAPKESNGFNDYYIHELLCALGMLYMEAGDKEKAIDYFEKSLKIHDGIRFNSTIMELQKTHKKSIKGQEQEWEEREVNIDGVKIAKEMLEQLKQG